MAGRVRPAGRLGVLQLRVGLQAQNITNAKSRQTMQQYFSEMGRAWFVTGPRYTVHA